MFKRHDRKTDDQAGYSVNQNGTTKVSKNRKEIGHVQIKYWFLLQIRKPNKNGNQDDMTRLIFSKQILI
jgi:hypothetical protein